MLRDAQYDDKKIESGILYDQHGHTFPIVNFIPRFVPEENYASNFSSQWENWPELLSFYDGYRDRFFNETKWGKDLKDTLMLEAGCGSGTFTPFAASTGATVLSFDLSTGVEANYLKSGHLENVLIVQADVFSIPTRKNIFDYIFCFGVLQHTPSPKGAFMELCSRLGNTGRLAVDNYTLPPVGHPYEMLWINKYRTRNLTANLSEKTVLNLVRLYVHVFWPITRVILSLSKKHGVSVNRYLLFDDYPPRLPGMDRSRFKSFAMLDIYDFLAPKYDNPVDIKEFESWFSEAGLKTTEVHPGYNGLEGRGSY